MLLYQYKLKNVIHFTTDIKSIPFGVDYTTHEIWC
jgi:hypothetical protein